MADVPPTEWARHLGASPSKRMVASWSGSSLDPTEYKVAARAIARKARLPSLVLDAIAKSQARATFSLDTKIPIQGSG
jgi:hypothetical protein